jgi:hypothetical protein
MEKPIKNSNLTLTEADDESILYDSASGKIHILNQVGARIWDLCDGEKTKEDIALLIQEEFETDAATASADTPVFLNELFEMKLISYSDLA